MARLMTAGGETKHVVSECLTALESNGVVSFTTATVRSGAAAFQMPTADEFASSRIYIDNAVVAVAYGRNYYQRGYVYLPALPTATPSPLVSTHAGSSDDVAVQVNTDGTLTVASSAASVSSVSTISAGQWVRVEFHFLIASSGATSATVGVRLDGTTVIADQSLAVTGFQGLPAFNWASLVGSVSYWDDLALNDDQGASQNSWPGDGKVVVLKPKADSARGTNWLAGAGATTNLWDAVDSAPPVGLSLASATNTSQVKNAAKDTTGLYDASVEAYSVAVASGGGGLVAGDTITLVQPATAIASSTTTVIQHGINTASNPGPGTEATINSNGIAAGTFPTGWSGLLGSPTYAPTPTRATRPVIRLRKGTSSTVAAMAASMGLLVEYVPAVVADAPPPSLVMAPRIPN